MGIAPGGNMNSPLACHFSFPFEFRRQRHPAQNLGFTPTVGSNSNRAATETFCKQTSQPKSEFSIIERQMSQITFQQSIETSHELIEKLERKTLPDSQAREEISEYLSDMATARGFFVSLLTGDWAFGTDIPAIVIDTIKTTPGHAYTLLTRNLVMSCATAVSHKRSEQPNLAEGSDRVAERSAYIIKKLDNAEILQELLDIKRACEDKLNGGTHREHDTGTYRAFLERWSYDLEQIRAALDCVNNVINQLQQHHN